MFKVEMGLHTFSEYLDDVRYVESIMKNAADRGINGVVVTNLYGSEMLDKFPGVKNIERRQNWFSKVEEAKGIGQKYGVKVFVGMEYITDEYANFYVIGFDGTELPEADMTYRELRKWADSRGYYLVQLLPNIVAKKKAVLEREEGIGYVLYNTSRLQKMWSGKEEVLKLTSHLNPVYIVSGECFSVKHVGLSYTEFENEVKDESELATIIKSRKFKSVVDFETMKKLISEDSLVVLDDIMKIQKFTGEAADIKYLSNKHPIGIGTYFFKTAIKELKNTGLIREVPSGLELIELLYVK